METSFRPSLSDTFPPPTAVFQNGQEKLEKSYLLGKSHAISLTSLIWDAYFMDALKCFSNLIQIIFFLHFLTYYSESTYHSAKLSSLAKPYNTFIMSRTFPQTSLLFLKKSKTKILPSFGVFFNSSTEILKIFTVKMTFLWLLDWAEYHGT